MNGDEVRRWEEEVEAAIAEILRRRARDLGHGRSLPDRTAHRMAKAAVAVLEAALDPPPPPRD